MEITLPLELFPVTEPFACNISVEEKNLSLIPFAVLEQRVGKRLGKVEVKGSKVPSNGVEVACTWQVQGNGELGLPTEQDLDIFLALGVLTSRNHFAKTIRFHGSDLATILNIASIHGKFYERLKLAIDRFVSLRFRVLTDSKLHEDVKWMNMFQEASFSSDRETGRCVGTITWTDRIIQGMHSGLFRFLDADRYMKLDGLTAKHMYRFLSQAFQSTDVVILDVRDLATQHLAIMNPPKYFSRLMQTLDLALEQLRGIEVVGSWHVVSRDEWRLAIKCHDGYMPERRAVARRATAATVAVRKQQCRLLLEQTGLPEALIEDYYGPAADASDLHFLERAAGLYFRMIEEQVTTHVAQQLIGDVLRSGAHNEPAVQSLDWIEIGLYICEQKRCSRKNLRNRAGLIVKLARDTESRGKMVSETLVHSLCEGFRKRERTAVKWQREEQERALLASYEEFRESEARRILASLPEETRQSMHQQKTAQFQTEDRYQRLLPSQVAIEVEHAVLNDLGKQHVPVFEQWRLRQVVRQAALPSSWSRAKAAENESGAR